MVPHVQLSTNYGLGCFKNKTKYSHCTNGHFFSGLTTAQAVDPLPLHRDFPGLIYLMLTTSAGLPKFSFYETNISQFGEFIIISVC
jgi:hypothetical protein